MVERVFDVALSIRDKCTLTEIKNGNDEKIKNRLKVKLDTEFEKWFTKKKQELDKSLNEVNKHPKIINK